LAHVSDSDEIPAAARYPVRRLHYCDEDAEWMEARGIAAQVRLISHDEHMRYLADLAGLAAIPGM
jgi:hypothetical protein